MSRRSAPPFELMRRIAEGHDDRSGSDRLSVVPVVVDDLASLLPLLRGTTDYLRGALLDATGPELDDPVRGDDDPTLRGTAGASLVIERPARDTAVEVVVLPDGRIDARFSGKGIAASGGDRQVLAVARALFAVRARSTEFAVLAYDESAGMDGPSRRACWRYITEGLPDLRLGTLRTLVVVVGIGVLDYDRHCAYGRGFHFGLLDGAFVRRRTDDSIAAAIATVTAPVVPYTVLFLGAGASASSGLPLGNAMRDETIRRLIRSSAEDSFAVAKEFRTFLDNAEHLLTPQEKALTIDAFATQLTLEQVVRVEQGLRPGVLETLDVFAEGNARALTASGGIGFGIRAVQCMAASLGRWLVIVEVNFDTLVEDGSEHLFERFTTEKAFEGAVKYLGAYLSGTVNRVPLLKVHGTIEDRVSCDASAEQTANGLPQAKADALMRLSGTRDRRVPWVYVGASMRDTDLTDVFKRREFADGAGVRSEPQGPHLDSGRGCACTQRYRTRRRIPPQASRCLVMTAVRNVPLPPAGRVVGRPRRPYRAAGAVCAHAHAARRPQQRLVKSGLAPRRHRSRRGEAAIHRL